MQIFPFLFQDYQYIVDIAFLNAEMQKILSLFDNEGSALHTSSTESLDGLAFFPICSRPGEIQHLFRKSKIGYTDTFKFLTSAFGNNIFPIYSWIFPSSNREKTLVRFPNAPSKYSGSLTPRLRTNPYVIT